MITPGLYQAASNFVQGHVFWYLKDNRWYVWKEDNPLWEEKVGIVSWEEFRTAFISVGPKGSKKGSIVIRLNGPNELNSRGQWYVELRPSTPLEYLVLTGKAFNPPKGTE